MSEYPIINPSWEFVFQRLLISPRPDPRITKWCKELLFPYIERHPDEFCYKMFIERFELAFNEEAWVGDRLVEVEGHVLTTPHNPLLSLNLMHDQHIVKFDATFDNREYHVRALGWMNNATEAALAMAAANKFRSDTRVSILLRHSSMGGSHLWGKDTVYLFAAHHALADLADWLVQAANIPLTVTKLPFKEAKRLSDEWHAKEARRKEKERERALKNMSPGDRELIGRLTVAPGNEGIAEETYEVFWCKDKQSLKYESMIQHHCVDGYWTYVETGRSLILHMRNVDRAKANDRWTIELGVIQFGSRAIIDAPLVLDTNKFVAVRQMRGISNCSPHPGLSTGFGNLFLHHDGKLGKSALFTDDSQIDAQRIVDQLTKPFGVLGS